MKKVLLSLFLSLFVFKFSYALELSLSDDYEIHGLLESRAGWRITEDKNQKANSITDLRLKTEIFRYFENFDAKFTGDVWFDGVTDSIEYETREAWFFFRPSDFADLKIGRQVLTWGTGDIVFLNDLFPKDWQSFFTGRDDEYLKASSDSIKISCFTPVFDFDLIYNPVFQRDRFIDGTYISSWDDNEKRFTGKDDFKGFKKPDSYFCDDEIHLRIYKNINNYELAFYGYSGFFKSPSKTGSDGKKEFTKMSSEGFSIRGNLGIGIANLEFAHYNSIEDTKGNNSSINNSELRYLAGYCFDIKKDFNINIQYYVEQILDYSEYKKSMAGKNTHDQYRHLITCSMLRSLMNQNLKLMFSGYYSPSDEDCYLKPKISYQYSDIILLETGMNIFAGREKKSFFTRFENNSNIYFSVSAAF